MRVRGLPSAAHCCVTPSPFRRGGEGAVLKKVLWAEGTSARPNGSGAMRREPQLSQHNCRLAATGCWRGSAERRDRKQTKGFQRHCVSVDPLLD